MIALHTTDTDTEHLLKSLIILESTKKELRELEASIEALQKENELLKRRETTLRICLSQACNEMEGIFRTTKALASPEIANDYTVWARYLELHYGRVNHCVDDVIEWLEKL